MTPHARLESVQRRLAMTIAMRALCAGSAAGLATFALLRFVANPGTSSFVAIAVGAAVAAMYLLRIRAVRSLSSVALWVEERSPSLRYSLVTIADGVSTPVLEAQASATRWWDDASRTLVNALVAPVLGLIVVVALAILLPRLGNESAGFAEGVRGARGAGATSVDPLKSVHVAVASPAYSGRRNVQLDDPTSIEALVGSTVTLTGGGLAEQLTASADSVVRTIQQRGNGWMTTFAMPPHPGLVRLRSSTGRVRLIVLAPVADASPAVTLMLPARDSIFRTAHGSVVLRAQLRDDIGLHDAAFELVVSSGGGENFTFRSATLGRVQLANQGEATLETRLSLDSLALKPGDVVQLRAVARDGNVVTGPGIGSSETRSLRIARPDEYDSVAVEQLPPPELEGQVLSQRMLLNLTEALVNKQRAITHPVLLEEARKIALEQRKLRKKVGDIVFARLGAEPLSEEGSDQQERGKLTPEQVLAMADSVTSSAGGVMDVEGDETPILAINKPLLEAFNAMWDAGRSLEVGEPAKAIPPMKIALAAIQRARTAERIYLRGRPGTTIVDVSKVRLSGKDKGTASLRETRIALNPVLRKRSATFERVTELMARDPDAAADSLLIMRVDALGDAPALAAALDEAARALRKRDNTAIPLAWTRVRRALGAADVQRTGIGAWLGAP